MIQANSYFSGAGLFDIGFLQAGITIQQSFEIDEVCCKNQRAINSLVQIIRTTG